MAIIYHQILIKAVRSKIYEAITTQGGISRWWTADCVVKPEVGFINEFRIGTQAHYKMKVIHLQSGYSVEWKCLNQHDDWSGTQLSFHLADKGEHTCLDFKQTGFSSESEAYASSNYQWARHLTLLKEYCEETGDGPGSKGRATALNAGKV
jgi:uncharacterized protein YndB with AHSA1/START domain